MEITALAIIKYFGQGTQWLFMAIALTGFVAAALAATTREDAFRAGDRQGKWVWVALLLGSSFAVATSFPFLSWIGLVVIGVYWFDVRPQLQNIINGSGGW